MELYIATSPKGKSYIGICRGSSIRRFRTHVSEARRLKMEGRSYGFKAAILKYGKENFTLRTLVICDNWDYLCDLEKKAIKVFKTYAPFGYNLTEGGEGCPGLSKEAEKRRAANVAKGLTGKKLTAAHRLALSEAHKGQVSWIKGKKFSSEVKDKMRESALRRLQRPEERERLLSHLKNLVETGRTKPFAKGFDPRRKSNG